MAAALVDVLLLVPVALAISVLSGGWGATAAALTSAWALYYYFALESGTGQTLGKRLLGIRVVRADGGAPTMREIAVRTVLRVVDGLFAYLVGLGVMLATGERRQRLGDLAAGTVVTAVGTPVKEDDTAVAPVAEDDPYFTEETQTLEEPAASPGYADLVSSDQPAYEEPTVAEEPTPPLPSFGEPQQEDEPLLPTFTEPAPAAAAPPPPPPPPAPPLESRVEPAPSPFSDQPVPLPPLPPEPDPEPEPEPDLPPAAFDEPRVEVVGSPFAADPDPAEEPHVEVVGNPFGEPPVEEDEPELEPEETQTARVNLPPPSSPIDLMMAAQDAQDARREREASDGDEPAGPR